MTGTKLSNHEMEPRRKRILIRAWHRGMREMDLLLGGYADEHLLAMSESELDDFERLLQAPDQQLFSWATGKEEIPVQYDSAVAQKFLASCNRGEFSLT